jgi:hypothetical protein
MELSNIKRLAKWTMVGEGIIAVANSMSLAIYLYVNQQLYWKIFIQLLLSYLILEGLVITLIGCIGFFGFEKYMVGVREKAESRSEHTTYVKSNKQTDLKFDFRALFVILGLSLFLPSFIIFSFLF